MNISYKREMRHNYLILEAAGTEEENFEIRMLTENSIEGLLKFRVKQEEIGRYYCYEITSKQPLSRLLEFKEIKKEELIRLIAEIGAVLKRIEDYLLSESNLFLEPEHIYIEPETYQVWLCYIPGYEKSFPDAMEKFLQYLLKKTNHKDDDAVVLAYRLYQESQKDYYGIEDLLRIVRESQQGISGENTEEIKKNKSNTYLQENTFLEEKSVYGEAAKNRKNRKSREKAGEEYCGEKEYSLQSPGNNTGKTGLKAVFALLGMIISGPLFIWLYAGEAGLRRYLAVLLVMDIAAALGVILYLWNMRKKNRQDCSGKVGEKRWTKEQEKTQKEFKKAQKEKEWQMTFEETCDYEEEQASKEFEKAGEGNFWESKNPWENKRDLEINISESENTVLLAEASLEKESQHLLKSVNPAISDISIPYFPFIIGKQEGIVDYALKKETISRIHLRIDEENGECKVTDLNSSNGTIVEDYRLEANESHSLNSGDKLVIADLSFIFY